MTTRLLEDHLEARMEELAATVAKRRAFAAQIEALLTQRDQLATEAVHRAWDLLEDLRQKIALELTTATGFDAFQLPRFKAALDQLGKDFAARYRSDLMGRLDAAWALGTEAIDEGLKTAGVTLGTVRLDTTGLSIVQGLSTDLITTLTADTIAAVSRQISLGVLGGQSVFETMRTITGILGSADAVQQRGKLKFVADGVAYRAEMITRTEMLRAYNVAHYARAQEAARAGVGHHQWRTARDGRVRASHKALEGKIVAVGEEFAPGLRFPLDPNGSAKETINCRCKALPAFGPGE